MISVRGVISPIITPFTEEGEIYEKGIRNLIDFLSEKGVHGLFAIGSYGSFPLMSTQERMNAAEIIISHAKKRCLQIIIHVGSPSTKTSIYLAQHAESAGADIVAGVVPFYYSSFGYDETSILKHYEKIVNSVRIPVHYYNNPRTTGYTLTPSFFSKLIDVGVTGVKDSGANMATFGEMMNIINKKRPDFNLLPGSASILLPGFMLGAKGCVAGTSTAFPEIVVALYNSIMNGDFEAATELQLRVIQARAFQGIKPLRAVVCYDILKMKGLDVGTCREPWSRLNSDEYTRLYNNLKEHGFI